MPKAFESLPDINENRGSVIPVVEIITNKAC